MGKKLKTNESYRDNLIKRLDDFYKMLLEEKDDYKILAEAVTDNQHYYDGGHYLAASLAAKFRLAFSVELKQKATCQNST